jgi:SAM-dependent methyltransferase
MAHLTHEAVNAILAPIATTYARRLKRYGTSPRGVFWRHQFGQYLRFEILIGILSRDEAAKGGLVFNDLGCGYGAFFDFLRDRQEMRGGLYIGYDMCPSMVEVSRRRIRDPRAEFAVSTVALRDADYSFVSGTFNMKLETDEATWNGYVKESLAALWQRSRRGLAFNMLDIEGKLPGDGLYYARAHDFVDFCRRELSPACDLVSNAPLKEWTVYVRR